MSLVHLQPVTAYPDNVEMWRALGHGEANRDVLQNGVEQARSFALAFQQAHIFCKQSEQYGQITYNQHRPLHVPPQVVTLPTDEHHYTDTRQSQLRKGNIACQLISEAI